MDDISSEGSVVGKTSFLTYIQMKLWKLGGSIVQFIMGNSFAARSADRTKQLLNFVEGSLKPNQIFWSRNRRKTESRRKSNWKSHCREKSGWLLFSMKTIHWAPQNSYLNYLMRYISLIFEYKKKCWGFPL